MAWLWAVGAGCGAGCALEGMAATGPADVPGQGGKGVLLQAARRPATVMAERRTVQDICGVRWGKPTGAGSGFMVR